MHSWAQASRVTGSLRLDGQERFTEVGVLPGGELVADLLADLVGPAAQGHVSGDEKPPGAGLR
ncbi:hypothetical protein ACTPOK_00610 [Streptomyces inhibens]|uniref:hypothetical protein n=1 Tax=Streptomyces inhibens TaxID=2293571 RepID=UPI00402A6999